MRSRLAVSQPVPAHVTAMMVSLLFAARKIHIEGLSMAASSASAFFERFRPVGSCDS